MLAWVLKHVLASHVSLPAYVFIGFHPLLSGRQVVTYPKQSLRLKDGMIRVPLGLKVKACFSIDSFSLPMPSNLKFEDIKELRILPRNHCFYAEFVYKLKPQVVEVDPHRVLGIDVGINNWLTCVSNIETSFIIDGKHVKSLNRWYNKQISTLKDGKPQGFWSKRLATIKVDPKGQTKLEEE